jgi:hypothetical protein
MPANLDPSREASFRGQFAAAVVVLAYGESPFLADCLRSLAAQAEQTPILVATSTPCDHIARAAKAVGAEIKVNPNRYGIAADWNFGLQASQARYVTLAHQDDVYASNFVGDSLAALSGSSDAVLAFTGYREIDDAGAPKTSKISRTKHLIEAVTLGQMRRVTGMRLRLYLSFGNPLPCSSVTFDRSRLPGFAFSPDFSSNLDWDAWWRLMRAGSTFARLPEPLVGRRHNALTATSRLIADGTRQAEDLKMFRRAWPWPLAEAIALTYRAGY